MRDPKAQRRALRKAPQSRQIDQQRARGMNCQPSLHLLAIGFLRGGIGRGVIGIDHATNGTRDDGHEREMTRGQRGAVDVPLADFGGFERDVGAQPAGGEAAGDGGADAQSRDEGAGLFEERIPEEGQRFPRDGVVFGLQEGEEDGVLE